jgi:DNA repair protein RadD
VCIEELVRKGHLAPLRSKVTRAKLSAEGVHKRGGEYIESELQAAVDKADKNTAVVREVIDLAGDRKSWLFFCAGVKHAQHVCDALKAQGIDAACVTGETPKKDRERVLAAFKRGELQALTNANVLTTGFDAPNVDLIAMLRPTLSPGLYVQMAGRGLRPKAHTDHCLVLDFAGVVETHGPIVNVTPPSKAKETTGEAPVKVCDACGELCGVSARECSACGEPFPPPKLKTFTLRSDDIMGLDGLTLDVSSWAWRKHVSRSSGKDMLSITYYGDLSAPPVTEYLPIMHDGYAGEKAWRQLAMICGYAGVSQPAEADLMGIAVRMSAAPPPSAVKYRKDGKFFRVISRSWER